ncbi:NAD(P)/FAD-dependent oxidoreductase [Micromonospora sp. NPDC047670]|uniref:NAD(P)/FAD-dependent oxidoreductase n=1 Tax=Micromonospora sp. NPDC047670 TaxID=3364252 RepID=UPI003718D465
MTHRIVVAGAGYAGLTAANRMARRLRGTGTTVTLVNARDRFVERVRLHQLAAGQRLRDLPLRDLVRDTGVRLVVADVTAVDPAARTVRLGAAPYRIEYDTLVYALGSVADLDGVPGAAAHAFAVASFDAAVRLRDHLADDPPRTGVLAVVGGGLTGIETAAELAEAHPARRIALVTAGALGEGLSARGGEYLRRALRRVGVAVHEGTSVTEVTDRGLVLGGGTDLAADAVVWATGFRAPALAREAGFGVDARGRITVDDTLRSTSHPQVYAVGDAAALPTPDGRTSRMSCQTGLPMGGSVADIVVARLAGREPGPARVRYVWQNISVGRRDGLTQFVRSDDSPVAATLTGRASARFKETVTRATVQRVRRPGPPLPFARFGPSGG